MCGIFALLNTDNNNDYHEIKQQFYKGKKRGPEYSRLELNYMKIILKQSRDT